jgi:hypothetical protein
MHCVFYQGVHEDSRICRGPIKGEKTLLLSTVKIPVTEAEVKKKGEEELCTSIVSPIRLYEYEKTIPSKEWLLCMCLMSTTPQLHVG